MSEATAHDEGSVVGDETAQRSADVLWLVPDKHANLSPGRQRIADGLRRLGYAVEQRARSLGDITRQLSGGYDAVMGTTSLGGILASVSSATDAAVVLDHVDPISQAYTTERTAVAAGLHAAENLAFRAADACLYVYDEERQRVHKRVETARQTTLGVDTGRFDAPPSRDHASHVADLLHDGAMSEGYAVYIGGYEPIYNIEALLDAAAGGEFPLVMAGGGSLSAMVERAAVQHDSIHNLGYIDGEYIPALLHYAGCGISLVDDPHTVKVLEYAAAGLPIVQGGVRAAGHLPDGTEYCTTAPLSIRNSVQTGLNTDAPLDANREWARDHEYSRVVADYDETIQQVL